MEEEYMKIIRQYLLLHNYDMNLELVKITDNMAEFMVALAQLDLIDDVRLKYVRRREVLWKGKEFYGSFFRVHDVYYGTDKMVHKLNAQNIETIDEIIDKFNEIGKIVSPYDIPVLFNQKKETNGYLSMLQVDFDGDVDDVDKFLKEMKHYFKVICLKRFPTELTYVSYIHEMAHLQLESVKGSIVDYNNSECISIFLEMVSLLGNPKLFQYNLKQRINFLLIEFDSLISYYYEEDKGYTIYDVFLTSKYVVSLLKAFKLLDLYMRGCNGLKKEMLGMIQDVFDGVMVVEDIFKKLDVEIDNSMSISMMKRLVK